MKKLQLFLALIGLSITTVGHSADIHLRNQIFGDDISTGAMQIVDIDFAGLGSGDFVDVRAFSYVRLGLLDEVGMQYANADKEITIEVLITPFTNGGVALTPFSQELIVYYDFDGSIGATADFQDYRMQGVHKFRVEVTDVLVNGSPATLPDFVFFEAGFVAERYYDFDYSSVPVVTNQLMAYGYDGSISSSSTGATSASSGWRDISFIWDYVEGAEYYELEWTWVDNYSSASVTSYLTASQINFSEIDFSRNCTRIRTTEQKHKIPLVFAQGYLIYRVRAVGRWLDNTSKEKFGKWSTYG